MPKASYELKNKEILRNGTHVATIQEDGEIRETKGIHKQWLPAVSEFLQTLAEDPPAAKKTPKKKETKTEVSPIEASFAAFAADFDAAKPVARLIFLKKNRDFFNSHVETFAEVFEAAEEAAKGEPATKRGPSAPAKHPDEPAPDPRYGDLTPAVVDWRKANWSESDFKRAYTNRLKGVERIRNHTATLDAMETINKAWELQQLNTPEVREAVATISGNYTAGKLEDLCPGITDKLRVIGQSQKVLS